MVVVSSDEEFVDELSLTIVVVNGSMVDVMGVTSTLTVTLTPINTSCLRRRSFDSTRGT